LIPPELVFSCRLATAEAADNGGDKSPHSSARTPGVELASRPGRIRAVASANSRPVLLEFYRWNATGKMVIIDCPVLDDCSAVGESRESVRL
jgi:hypothetical protein